MKFSSNKYRVLDDVGDKGVLLSEGTIRSIDALKENAKEVEEVFGTFCREIINNCKKGYYLSRQINNILSEDNSVQEKLIDLLHELNPTKGIMLLPSFKYSSLFNSFSYYIDKSENSTNELNFSISYHSLRGLEIFISGSFFEKKFKSISIVADDIEFYEEQKSIFENLINYALNIILFMQFAEIETIITEGKESKGKSKIKFNKEKYLNETNIPIEIIDSNWFTRLIRTGAFKVNGHFRLQPYGSGNSLRKLIWIDDYNKHGYKMNPKILKNNLEDEKYSV